MRSVAVVVLVLALPWAAACRRQSASLPMEQETFVEVMVALRRAANELGSEQSLFEQRKAEILATAGVTEAELRAYAREAPRRPAELAEAYDSIAAQLQRYQEPE
jgi:hypothetical protein